MTGDIDLSRAIADLREEIASVRDEIAAVRAEVRTANAAEQAQEKQAAEDEEKTKTEKLRANRVREERVRLALTILIPVVFGLVGSIGWWGYTLTTTINAHTQAIAANAQLARQAGVASTEATVRLTRIETNMDQEARRSERIERMLDTLLTRAGADR